MHIPSVWGDGGALFAFSGMDGATNWKNPLVGSTLGEGRGVVFHSPGRPTLRVGLLTSGEAGPQAASVQFEDRAVSGGLITTVLRSPDADVRFEFVFESANALQVRATAERIAAPTRVFLESRSDTGKRERSGISVVEVADGAFYALRPPDEAMCDVASGRAIVELEEPGKPILFGWGFGRSRDGALKAAERAAGSDADALVARQTDFFRGLPTPSADPLLAETFAKCASVLKMNCYSPEGRISCGWTTPDRWPHQHMWIWDSAFHAIGLRHIDGRWAEDAIRAVLMAQRDDGFIPHTITPDGKGDSDIIQPPILAWGSWRVYETTRSREFLQWVYPRIGKMVRYDCERLDSDCNGLSEWEGSNASGMDNSPRFDTPVGDAVDLNSYLVSDMKHLARIAREIGRPEGESAEWERLAAERAARINEMLWDDETGFYYDRGQDGNLVRVKTQAGFTPLFAGICDGERLKRVIAHLTSADEFWRPFPVSSVAADELTFSDNMWRGPVWINYNYFIIDGLVRAGCNNTARQLRKLTLDEIARWYARDGLIYEFYDSEAKTNPVHLHRKKKGGPSSVRSTASLGTTICDYNFTAALFVDLLMGLPQPMR